MINDLLGLFSKLFGSHADFSRAVPVDTFLMSYAPVVNGWRQGRNELTGRVYWYNRQGRVRVAPPP